MSGPPLKDLKTRARFGHRLLDNVLKLAAVLRASWASCQKCRWWFRNHYLQSRHDGRSPGHACKTYFFRIKAVWNIGSWTKIHTIFILLFKIFFWINFVFFWAHMAVQQSRPSRRWWFLDHNGYDFAMSFGWVRVKLGTGRPVNRPTKHSSFRIYIRIRWRKESDRSGPENVYWVILACKNKKGTDDEEAVRVEGGKRRKQYLKGWCGWWENKSKNRKVKFRKSEKKIWGKSAGSLGSS